MEEVAPIWNFMGIKVAENVDPFSTGLRFLKLMNPERPVLVILKNKMGNLHNLINLKILWAEKLFTLW